jgi:hypothetical protein
VADDVHLAHLGQPGQVVVAQQALIEELLDRHGLNIEGGQAVSDTAFA